MRAESMYLYLSFIRCNMYDSYERNPFVNAVYFYVILRKVTLLNHILIRTDSQYDFFMRMIRLNPYRKKAFSKNFLVLISGLF